MSPTTMLAVHRGGNGIRSEICHQCALRLRLLSFQQRRRRHATRDRTHEDGTSQIRYYMPHESVDLSRNRGASVQHIGGVVRKHFIGGLKQYGLDAESISRKRELGFKDALATSLQAVKAEVRDTPMLGKLAGDKETTGKRNRKEDGFNGLWQSFAGQISQGEHTAARLPFTGKESREKILWDDLKLAWNVRGQNGLDDRLKYAFYGHVSSSRFTEGDIKNQQTLADLRYPTEWYPATRVLHRTIHLHVGPTNSGKTYHALQRLEQANRGVYAGPLRLLAHEVYSRMNAKGRPCSLITGEERRAAESKLNDGYDLSACTVEMMPLNRTLDVAVIDEIQMIGNAERGWAWTQALLGVKAKEVHLCGEERTVPLIRELCASLGDKLEIHRYERLSPLRMSDVSLAGDLKRLRKGDCIVSFSVMGIHALRQQIEKSTGRKVATVYGSLPPETRAQQARLFNDPDNEYDYLVASDAVGMGLNLAIKRIIFETSSKFDGAQRRTLAVADIKQIAGRAGRFRTAAQANETPASKQDLAAAKGEEDAQGALDHGDRKGNEPENVGLVTTLERFDHPIVAAAMQSEPEPIQTAGIFPPAPVLERFASYFPPATPFSYILTRLHELSQMHQRFHLCGLKDQVWIADIIESVEGLTIADRNIICSAPASKSDSELWQDLMPAYARCIATQSGVSIADIMELPLETLEAEVSPSREYLRALERLHKGVVTYLWLSYRFAGIFNTRALAFHVKTLVEEKIEYVLGQFSFSELARKKLAKAREREILKGIMADESDQTNGNTREMTSRSPREYEPDAGEDSIRPTATEEANSGNRVVQQLADGEPFETGFDEQLGGEALQPRADFGEQTTLTAGGDRFGGEEDMTLEEPDADVASGGDSATSEKEPRRKGDAAPEQSNQPVASPTTA